MISVRDALAHRVLDNTVYFAYTRQRFLTILVVRGGAQVLKISWENEAEHLVCKWSVAEDVRFPYKALWMQDCTELPPSKLSPLLAVLDFRRLSPFGGKGWFRPNLRTFS